MPLTVTRGAGGVSRFLSRGTTVAREVKLNPLSIVANLTPASGITPAFFAHHTNTAVCSCSNPVSATGTHCPEPCHHVTPPQYPRLLGPYPRQ